MLIIAELGQLKDIPKELANTVANIYYKFINDYIYYSRPYAAPPNLAKGADLRKSVESAVNDMAQSIADFEAIKLSIKELRKIDKNAQPNLYRYWADCIIDDYKYNIKNINKKGGIWRMIERKFKKVNEI